MDLLKTMVVVQLVALLSYDTSRADELFLPVEFEEPVISQSVVGDIFYVPGADLVGEPGQPLLPHKTFMIVLPYGHSFSKLVIENLITKPIEGTFDIAPADRPLPFYKTQLSLPTAADPRIYGLDDPFPGYWAKVGSMQYKMGYAVLPVTISPISYHPQSGKVESLVSATIVVSTKPSGSVSRLFRATTKDKKAVLKRIDHSAAIYSYPKNIWRGPLNLDPGEYEYLIIAPDVFIGIESEYSLENLRDARIDSGTTAQITSLEWIRENYDGIRPHGGQDDATRIREYLTDAYQEWNTRYVLLVGDADAGDVGGESGDNLLQVRKLYVNMGYDPDTGQDTVDRLPADMYYGCLDGSFDYDRDGVYGEHNDGPYGGEVDLLSELYVGRAPADSVSEVENFVAKTLAYEQAAGVWLKEVWMIGEYLFEGPVWGGTYMDELIVGSSIGGFETVGFNSFPFFESETLYDRTTGQANAWGPGELIPILDNGPHIVNHLGHSDVTYNMRLVNSHVDGLMNNRPFFLFSQGCLAGSFDNRAPAEYGGYVYSQDSIAEHMVMGEHGPFAAVMNSRYGLGSYSTDGPSQRFHRQFWDAVFAEGISSFGQALADSKEDNASGFAYDGIRWAGFTANLLGDPVTKLKKTIGTDQPLLGVYPPGNRLYAVYGQEAIDPITLYVRNDGVGELSFVAEASSDWLIVTPQSGTAPGDIEVQIDPIGLEPGEHQGVITFNSPEAENSPLEYVVELNLISVPKVRLADSSQAPTVDGVIDPGEYAEAEELYIDREEAGNVKLHMMVSGTKLYLAVDDLLDTSAGDHDHMMILFDRDLDGVWPTSVDKDGMYWIYGDGYTGYVAITNSGDGYRFNWNTYQQNPAGLEAQGGHSSGHAVYELAIDLEESKLDVGPDGTFGMFFQVRDQADWQNMEVTGIWPRQLPSLDHQQYFGHVDMAPEGKRIASTPKSLQFTALAGDQNPAAQSLTIYDYEGDGFSFRASSDVDWINLNLFEASTPQEILVSVDQANIIGPGRYEGNIIIESEGIWNSPLMIPVSLVLEVPPARLDVSPTSFSGAVAREVGPTSLSLEVKNIGGAPLFYEVISDQDWLIPSISKGSLGGWTSHTVVLDVALDQLDLGSYQAQVLVEAQNVIGSPVTIPIEIEVVDPRDVPPMHSISIFPRDQSLKVVWRFPEDPIVAGTIVRRAVGLAPQSHEVGELVYQGSYDVLMDENLQNGIMYCYSAFSFDLAGRVALPVSTCGAPGENQAPPIPTCLSPVDKSSLTQKPTLYASLVEDPEGDQVTYLFRLMTDESNLLDSGVGEIDVDRVGWSPTVELEKGVQYYWQVSAADAQGASLGFSIARSFSLREEIVPDAGDKGQPDDGAGGCGCGQGRGNVSFFWLLIFGAAMMIARRRSQLI
jgi:hypothetical protein